jgi:hypothetical protein
MVLRLHGRTGATPWQPAGTGVGWLNLNSLFQKIAAIPTVAKSKDTAVTVSINFMGWPLKTLLTLGKRRQEK